MRVEADLFSGRPNPAWTLDAARADVLADLLRALPSDPVAAGSPPDHLGYRGIVVYEVHSVLPGCDTLRVHGGRAYAECTDGLRTFADAGRTVERWLADTGRSHLDPDLYALIGQELGS